MTNHELGPRPMSTRDEQIEEDRRHWKKVIRENSSPHWSDTNWIIGSSIAAGIVGMIAWGSGAQEPTGLNVVITGVVTGFAWFLTVGALASGTQNSRLGDKSYAERALRRAEEKYRKRVGEHPENEVPGW